ncbi:MAG: hypothetical protein COV71_03320 [Candidatus Omnitrophica bacterium CG11_big_fil_rev_8_21_14_0_20_41_12]|nr:MAG: hypothetical protein COV71_03320 [Candidatus Omnitrophica bacterium CG11_big_fil_rev_8_21_14_0_20_41_12]
MVKKFIIGIDLGGTNLKCALLDTNLKIRAKNSFSTRSFNNKPKLIVGIVGIINSFIFNHGLARSSILGVGLGLPGPIDTFGGIVHFFPNIKGWNNVGFKKILEKKLKLPIVIDNDANLMTLAEHRCGAAAGYKNALCLTLGTGVGGGLIINGVLFRGADNAAGEIGHLPLNENGPPCGCGSRACLESYIGNNTIIKEASKLFGRQISLEEVSRLAGHNNAKAIKFWSKVGQRLGLALSGAVNLLNLDVVVIGGGVAGAGNILFKSVKQAIWQRAMSVQAKRVKIFKAKLGVDAGLIGAGYLVKERLLK